MRKTITSAMLLIFVSAVVVHAWPTGIELISQTYTASGGYHLVTTYEITSPTSAHGDDGSLHSSAAGFPMFGGYPPQYHGLVIWLNTNIEYPAGSNDWVSAVSEVTFRPLESLLRIKADVWAWCSTYANGQWNFLFKDLTTGDTLFDENTTWSGNREFDVDPSHEYYLKATIAGQVPSGPDDDDWHWPLYLSAANLYLNPIPVPSAMLLVTIGFGCVTWLRRRKTL